MLDRYYFLASLPAMGELGTEPPMGFAELLEHLAGSWSRHVLLGAIFLLDDLVQREAHLAGELAEVDPAVLSVQQASGEQPLPDYLLEYFQTGQSQTSGALADRLWDAYFRFAEAAAKRLGSPFLRDWVHYEVSLRNALVTMRSKRLGLEASEYLVAKDLSTMDGDFDTVLAEWASAPTPLAGQQVLLRSRWTWVDEHDAWFTFRDDELAAYAIRLMLLQQWSRIASDAPKRATAEGAV